MSDEKVKQTIVMRHDLHLRMGKAVAQGAHASNWVLTTDLDSRMKDILQVWQQTGTIKIVLRVNSVDELLEIKKVSEEAGLLTHAVIDLGYTEFHGIPTLTCLAIGPDYASKIDPITGHLKPL